MSLVFGIILMAYIAIGSILAFVAVEKMEEVFGPGSFGGMGFVLIGCLFMWPLVFPDIMREVREEKKKKDE